MNQFSLALGHELIVDLFAGGGGASTGIEAGIGRPVDIAVNHDPEAVAMHRENHPHTRHFCESVFRVDPRTVTRNQPIGLLWASPDCTHHSKAKGGKPVSNKRRGLAWVVIRWARRTRPRCIMLENVEEFAQWGPIDREGRPRQDRKGQTFRQWVAQLERLGYRVEWRELRACDYGAPTIRKRLFVVARCDGRPIVWPKPTHGAPDSPAVKRGRLQPYRTAAECVDWSIPCPSIFERKRPLAGNTLRRIAKGVMRYVVESPAPFIVKPNHGYDWFRGQAIDKPLQTITAGGNQFAVVVPHVLTNTTGHSGAAINEPVRTITTGGHHALVAAFLAKHYTGVVGHEIDRPAGTITTADHHAVVAAQLLSQTRAGSVGTGGTHAAQFAAFLSTYYGNSTFVDPREPVSTVTTRDRLQLVTVTIDGESYVVADIGMRMLQPRELFRAQGFSDGYIIDFAGGKRLTKKAQVRMCGNSVCPPLAQALVEANFKHESKLGEIAA